MGEKIWTIVGCTMLAAGSWYMGFVSGTVWKENTTMKKELELGTGLMKIEHDLNEMLRKKLDEKNEETKEQEEA